MGIRERVTLLNKNIFIVDGSSKELTAEFERLVSEQVNTVIYDMNEPIKNILRDGGFTYLSKEKSRMWLIDKMADVFTEYNNYLETEAEKIIGDFMTDILPGKILFINCDNTALIKKLSDISDIISIYVNYNKISSTSLDIYDVLLNSSISPQATANNFVQCITNDSICHMRNLCGKGRQ